MSAVVTTLLLFHTTDCSHVASPGCCWTAVRAGGEQADRRRRLTERESFSKKARDRERDGPSDCRTCRCCCCCCSLQRLRNKSTFVASWRAASMTALVLLLPRWAMASREKREDGRGTGWGRGKSINCCHRRPCSYFSCTKRQPDAASASAFECIDRLAWIGRSYCLYTAHSSYHHCSRQSVEVSRRHIDVSRLGPVKGQG